MAHDNLVSAKKAQKDEFYTQYQDIQKEVNAYLEYDPNVFRGKTIFLPCDDPEWSNFTRFFAQNFEKFGLKKLISTSYAIESKEYKDGYQLTLFEKNSPEFDANKTRTNGKIFVLAHDSDNSRTVDIDDLKWHYLNGDGDFRSEEVKKLRDEADIIITNPPFSLLREFILWVLEAEKNFLIIGNFNTVITCNDIFPYIKNNKLWTGATNFNTGMYFGVPDDFEHKETYKFEKERNGKKVNRVPSICWFTNLDHGRRHQPLPLMTMAENIKYSKHKEIKGIGYYKYDNYDAIEVNYYDAIPKDYDGIMGVAITFLGKHCPEQYEIVALSRYLEDSKGMSKEFVETYYAQGNTGAISEGHPDLCYYDKDGVANVPYMRLLIKPKKEV
ncbi:MAG: methyltransferase [Anaerocolumna sp.]|jgi:hypothetical protein|nr:methyltransferase [Anaerocolumna sp.]